MSVEEAVSMLCNNNDAFLEAVNKIYRKELATGKVARRAFLGVVCCGVLLYLKEREMSELRKRVTVLEMTKDAEELEEAVEKGE